MQKELEKLQRLQEIDYELGELERSKDYLPDMINNLEKEIEETSSTLEQLRKEFTDQNLLRKRLETEVDAQNEELKKFQEQMRVIKTNREYDALTTEIANKKLKISENEEKILELMSSIDDLKEKIAEYEQKCEEVNKNNHQQLSTLRKKMDSIGSTIEAKEEERKAVTDKVDKRIMSMYERIKKGVGNHVVVAVKKRACGACFKSLPPQRIQEIRRGDRIITCDSCGRILIWIGE
jgi:predicted  nucleic acid-binding Zn-ribbon protein